jgi:hypothetical protein
VCQIFLQFQQPPSHTEMKGALWLGRRPSPQPRSLVLRPGHTPSEELETRYTTA